MTTVNVCLRVMMSCGGNVSLSSFEEKLRGTTTFCHQKKKKKKVPRMMMESQHRKIEEKFSFRVLQGKKKVQRLSSHLHKKKEQQSAR